MDKICLFEYLQQISYTTKDGILYSIICVEQGTIIIMKKHTQKNKNFLPRLYL